VVEAPSQPIGAEDLVLGVHPAGDLAVVDGDTLRIRGRPNVRVLALDTEEILRDAEDRRAAALDFPAYAAAKRPPGGPPVKFGTPAGDRAREFVKALVGEAQGLRLERDVPGAAEHDAYGRLLAHVVLLHADGRETLLAEAVIEAGHSPYFVKYGRSLRHDARLQAAEARARAAQRGIFGDGGPAHYPDYPERLAWWRARADQVDRWRRRAAGPGDVELGTPDALGRLAALEGRPARVFGLLESTNLDGWPKILYLRHQRGRDLPLVVFRAEVWAALDLAELGRWFLTVSGPVGTYRGRPQIVIDDPAQIQAR
jgi:micrococcal nuclease